MLLLSLAPLAWGADLPAEGEDATGRLMSPSVPMDPAQRRDLGQALCGAPLEDLEDGGIGCAVCPGYTAEPSQTEGLSVNNLVYGRFTGPGVEEVLLDTDGCESHAEGFGGGVLLRRADGGWARVFYQAAVRLDDCLVFKGEAQDRLVCNEHYSGQGTVLGTISEMQVGADGVRRRQLLRWADNLSSDSRELISVLPQALMATDVDGDGRADLRVQMERFRYRLPKGVEDLEEARERGLAIPETVTETYDFIQLDAGFALVEARRPGLRELDSLVAHLVE